MLQIDLSSYILHTSTRYGVLLGVHDYVIQCSHLLPFKEDGSHVVAIQGHIFLGFYTNQLQDGWEKIQCGGQLE